MKTRRPALRLKRRAISSPSLGSAGEISLDEFVNALCAEPEPIVLEGMPFDGGLVDDGAPPPDDPKGGEAAPLEPRRGGIFGGGEEEEEEENDDDKWSVNLAWAVRFDLI